ncbi:YybH family protein [Streptomyces cyaneofuscatus]|uniref:YybH family protein n=1 Tax=Streptomyces cyaneofuscatus TaxID=66883 RepID=UPI003417ECF0
MTENTAPVELPSEIEEHLDHYVAAFNAGDADAVNSLYTEDAVGVWEIGNPLNGEARRAFLKEFLADRKPTIDADVREAYVAGDTTFLVVDWTMQITGDDGAREQLRGVGLDVLRRVGDQWRYAVDLPFGDEHTGTR